VAGFRSTGSAVFLRTERLRVPDPIRVLVAVDSAETLSMVQRVCLPTCELVEAVHDGWAMLQAAERYRTDLIIADLDMKGLDGIEATARLPLSSPVLPVIILATDTDAELVEEAFDAGALAYVAKCDVPQHLVEAVHTVLTGGRFISRSCGS